MVTLRVPPPIAFHSFTTSSVEDINPVAFSTDTASFACAKEVVPHKGVMPHLLPWRICINFQFARVPSSRVVREEDLQLAKLINCLLRGQPIFRSEIDQERLFEQCR